MSPCDTFGWQFVPVSPCPFGLVETDPLLAKQVLSQLSYTPAVGFQVQPLVSLCEVPSTTFVAMDLQN